MGLLENFERVNAYGKKRCRSLFWRMRAAVKKAFKKNGGKQHLKFQYDPSSYALNFDDGSFHQNRDAAVKKFIQVQEITDDINNTTWVYVYWINTNDHIYAYF